MTPTTTSATVSDPVGALRWLRYVTSARPSDGSEEFASLCNAVARAVAPLGRVRARALLEVVVASPASIAVGECGVTQGAADYLSSRGWICQVYREGLPNLLRPRAKSARRIGAVVGGVIVAVLGFRETHPHLPDGLDISKEDPRRLGRRDPA